MQKYVIEFLGTLGLVAAVAFTGNPALILGALAIAIGLGKGHYNPAVTAWSYLAGKLTQSDALLYVGAQLAASVVVILMGSL